METNIEVRKARRKDFPSIKELIRLYPQELIQDDIPAGNKFFVAEKGKRIVGCAALDVYSKRLAEIRSLAVVNEYQGNGISSKLIQACLALAKEKGIAQVLAITGARQVFEKQGFDTVRDGKDAVWKMLIPKGE